MSPSLNSVMAHQQDSGHTSIGWGCKIEWFDRHGLSMGYAPKSFPGWTSSESPSQRSPRGHSKRTHGAQSAGHPTTHPSVSPSSDNPSVSKDEDSQCIFEALSTLQLLIFQRQSKVFDVKLHLELLEHCISLATDLSI
jgi:hypothetical protein